jgi:hypothetical protein
MSWEHTRVWACQVAGHTGFLFRTAEALEDHFIHDHDNDVPSEQVPFMIEKGARPAPDLFIALAAEFEPQGDQLSTCPFCTDPDTTVEAQDTNTLALLPPDSYKMIRDHITGHLLHLALVSLPPREGCEDSMATGQNTTQQKDSDVGSDDPSFSVRDVEVSSPLEEFEGTVEDMQHSLDPPALPDESVANATWQ